MGSGNAYTPATPAQIRYVVQWFQEWSEMQRSDFLPLLIKKFHNKGVMNGLISNMDSCSVEDRPPSIFQCRVKLFNQWADAWNEKEKEQLINGLKSIDQQFVRKFENHEISVMGTKEVLTNGNGIVPGEC